MKNSDVFLLAAQKVESNQEKYGCVAIHNIRLRNENVPRYPDITCGSYFELFYPDSYHRLEVVDGIISWWGDDKESRLLALLFCYAMALDAEENGN